MELLRDVVIALSSVILALVAFIRYYLPHHDRNLHNPWAEKIEKELQRLVEETITHNTAAQHRHEAVIKALERIEGKLP